MFFRFGFFIIISIVFSLLLFSNMAPTPIPVVEIAPPPPDLHILADPDPIIATLTMTLPTTDLFVLPLASDPAMQAVWADPITHWCELAQRSAELDGLDAAEIEAEQAMLEAALHDGLIVATQARAQGHVVADNAVLAEIGWRLIEHNHPLRADNARNSVESAAGVSAESSAAVVNGRMLGSAVAQTIISTL